MPLSRPAVGWAAVAVVVGAAFACRLQDHVTPATLGCLLTTVLARKRHLLCRVCWAVAVACTLISLLLTVLHSSISPLTPSLDSYALVTGASSGIGKAIATNLAQSGFNLVLVARRHEKLKELASQLKLKYNINTLVFGADLAQDGAAVALYRQVQERKLQVDILVNNAGVGHRATFLNTSSDKVEQMLGVNVKTTTMLSHLIIPEMVDRGYGRVMIVSSVYGLAPGGPIIATYAATKAFLSSFTLALQSELEGSGVGVTLLMPGSTTNTDFAETANAVGMLSHRLPFGLHLDAQYVANVSVDALLRGDQIIIPGLLNRLLYAGFMVPFLPRKLVHVIGWLAITPLGQILQVLAPGAHRA